MNGFNPSDCERVTSGYVSSARNSYSLVSVVDVDLTTNRVASCSRNEVVRSSILRVDSDRTAASSSSDSVSVVKLQRIKASYHANTAALIG